jgi:hypothetical protein
MFPNQDVRVSLLHPVLPKRMCRTPLGRLHLFPTLRSNGVDPLQNPALGRAHWNRLSCGIKDIVLRHQRREITILVPTGAIEA